MSEHEQIGEIIKTFKRARREKGISQATLSDQLGINVHTLYRWENDRALPSFAMFLRWCRKLELDLTVQPNRRLEMP